MVTSCEKLLHTEIKKEQTKITPSFPWERLGNHSARVKRVSYGCEAVPEFTAEDLESRVR